jgi:hypothetical protein
VINAQVLNGFITPVLLTYILILANRRSVLGNAANGPIFRAVATLCVTVVGLLSAVVLMLVGLWQRQIEDLWQQPTAAATASRGFPSLIRSNGDP